MNTRMSRRPTSLLLSSLLLVPCFAACASSADEGLPNSTSTPTESSATLAATTVVEPRAWEHERSDIPVDARIQFGALDNGLRFAWALNPEPQDRCYVRLHVDVGSLAEEEHERGMAHFLEHMAFNGSEHFEPGTLIEWFQEHGMSFGADTNAHTSFSETVYKLDLPEADEETLREGLLVLRDFADGLLLLDEEIQNEKGVIDGEERERDSAGMRVMIQELDLRFAGTRVAERLPIGTKEARDAFDDVSVRAFYERWYRPDAMTLVVVGDLGELDPAALIAEYFDDMTAPDEALAEEPEIGNAERYDFTYVIHEEEIPSVTLTVERLSPWVEEPVTIAEWLEDLPLGYGRSMLNLRFSEIVKQADAPFLGASVSGAEAFEVFEGEGLRVTCAPERWSQALSFAEQELRRAVEYGFQQAELDEVRASALRALDESVEREPTAHSRGLLGSILTAAEDRHVPTSAATRRDIVRPAIEALTIEACHAALAEAWARGELTLSAVGDLELGEQAGQLLSAAYDTSAAVAVEAGETIATQEFAYASDPARAGVIASREHVEDFDFERVRFENGVALNVKRTEFKERTIRVGATLGEGQLTLEKGGAALDWLAGRVFTGGGLEAHSTDDLRRLTAGKQVGVSFGSSGDSFGLGGATTAEDLLLQCELICAYLQAPGWREDGLVQLRRQLPLYYESLRHQHGGPYMTEFRPALHDHDPRIEHPGQEQVTALGMDDLEAWLAPHLAEAPLEVSLVGDLDVEATLAIAARTFGALPPRRAWRAYDEHRDLPPELSGIAQEHTIETEVPKALVVIVYPATDGMEAATRRRLSVLNTVLNDRLRLEVRERLGAAYSPGSSQSASRIHPGVGSLTIQAMSDPDKVDTLVEACLAAADDLAVNGVTDEEADRLREPILTRLRDSKRQNGYWMAVLGRAQRNPERLDDYRSLDAFYESYTAADISPLAAEYLGREHASTLIVRPQESTAVEAASDSAEEH